MNERNSNLAKRSLAWSVVAGLAVALIGGTWGAMRSAHAQESPPRFAASMPRGALVYLEARDLSGLLATWMKSPLRQRYFDSASYRAFKRSRLYLKLQDRLGELQSGFGVDLTDERLAELSGGPSAIAIYDPGKLDILVVSEVPRAKALASSLFAQAKSFEERKTAKGESYYAREVVTDGGNDVARIAFGYAGDRLWIGTNEASVAQAIDGPVDGGLQPAIAETIKASKDFSAHDVFLWLDLDRSVRNKYFNLYWIQRNAKDLQGLSSALVDVEFGVDGVHERRWFVNKEPRTTPAGANAESLASLRALAPPGTQLVEAKAADAGVASSVARTLFGPDRTGTAAVAISASTSTDPFDDDDDSKESSAGASNRYRYLDSRFDSYVDDPALAAPPQAQTVADASKQPSFGDRVAAFVAATSPVRYATFSSVELPQGKLFATFDRSVVVELGAPDRFTPSAFEALISEEFGRRFVVGGDGSRAAWTDVDGVRSLAGSLVDQGGAYRLSGKYLVVAHDAATCARIAAQIGTLGSASPVDMPAGVLSRYAEVRIDAARTPFVRLVNVLDSHDKTSVEEDVSSGDDGDDAEADDRPVAFFSENIASLLDVARELETVRIATTVDGTLLRERVDYVWAANPRPAAVPARTGTAETKKAD